MNKKIKIWLGGLVSTLSGAISISLSSALVSPETFNFDSSSGIKRLFIIAGISGLISVLNYLKQSPLPCEE